jgi:4-hydroxybenzoate polyprenyltransferase
LNNEADMKSKDAPRGNWTDRYAPRALLPYLRLARIDRPIGTWLLLWPGLWSIALAAGRDQLPDLRLVALFAVGAFLMRGAGCTLNDLVDRNFDAQVDRTRSRPLPSGQVSVFWAIIFMTLLALLGLMVLMELNNFAINVGLWSLPLIALYPYVKRVSYWPQFVLGLTFNWGALLGWAAVTGDINAPAILLYVGGIFWTLGYDTIYAHQDKEDDALIGVKSSALKLGIHTKPALLLFYVLAAVLFTAAGNAAGLGPSFLAGIAIATFHMVWQVISVKTENADSCLLVFKSNTMVGWIIFIAIIVGQYL